MNAKQIVEDMFLSLKSNIVDSDQDTKDKIADLLLDLIDQELEYTNLDDFLFEIEELIDDYSERVEKRYC